MTLEVIQYRYKCDLKNISAVGIWSQFTAPADLLNEIVEKLDNIVRLQEIQSCIG